MEIFRSTTILAVQHNGKGAMGGDGQVSFGDAILKQKARKVRTIFNQKVLAGFAGASADAFTLFEKFESRLEQYEGNLSRAAVELAKEWRSDRYLRRLEAQLVVLDKGSIFLISGTGDVIGKVTNNRLDIATDIANFRELGSFDFDEGSIGKSRQPPGDLSLAYTCGADQNDIVWINLISEIFRYL